jgi:hypothetical protein
MFCEGIFFRFDDALKPFDKNKDPMGSDFLLIDMIRSIHQRDSILKQHSYGIEGRKDAAGQVELVK